MHAVLAHGRYFIRWCKEGREVWGVPLTVDPSSRSPSRSMPCLNSTTDILRAVQEARKRGEAAMGGKTGGFR